MTASVFMVAGESFSLDRNLGSLVQRRPWDSSTTHILARVSRFLANLQGSHRLCNTAQGRQCMGVLNSGYNQSFYVVTRNGPAIGNLLGYTFWL